MLPFTTSQFFEVFARHNEGVRPIPALLLAAVLVPVRAGILSLGLAGRGRPHAG